MLKIILILLCRHFIPKEIILDEFFNSYYAYIKITIFVIYHQREPQNIVMKLEIGSAILRATELGPTTLCATLSPLKN